MRNNLKKKISITAASCLALACVSVGGAVLASANETDPALLMENDGAFYMVEGAGVKLYEGSLNGIDGNAMRFIFEMSEAQYGAMIENGAYKDGFTVYSYVIAEDNIDEDKTSAQEIVNDSDVIETEIPVEKWTKATSKVKGSTATVYYACAYVYNLPKEYYDDNVASFAVATTSEGKLYTSVQSRSMSYVADAAIESGEYKDDKTILESYLTDKFVWVKDVSTNTVVTDYTTGNYTRVQNQNTGVTYFEHINGSGYPQANPGIVTEEIGGIKGTYARIGVGEGQGSQYETIPYYLPNTMSVEKLQEFADRGYTLKLNLYIDAPDVNKNLTVYTVTTNNGVIASTVANMRAETIVTNAWEEVEININDYIALVESNGKDYKEQLSAQRNEATLCINLGSDYDVYFDAIKIALPVVENVIVSSPEEPSGWYTKSAYTKAHQYSRLKDATKVTETVGGIYGTYGRLTQDSAKWAPALIGNTLPYSTLERYLEKGYTLKQRLFVSSTATTGTASVRTVQYNYDGDTPTRCNITSTTEGVYTREVQTVALNTWVDVVLDFKDYIQDCKTFNGTYPTQIKTTGVGTIAIKAGWTYKLYLGDLYLEAPTGEDVKTVNEGESVTVETPTATEVEAYEYYQVVDGKYTQLKNNTVVAGGKDFGIAVVKVTKGDNGKEVRTLYKAYKVKVTPKTV